MLQYCRLFINNYYWLIVVLGFTGFVELPDWSMLLIIGILIVVAVLFSKRLITFNSTDLLFLLLMAYFLISFIFSSYPFRLYYLGVRSQIIPMFFFFIGKSKFFVDDKFLIKMKKPIMIAMVAGLVLYFWSPSWYIAKRTASLAVDATKSSFFEATRLSSFWSWSYMMGYSSLYFMMYFIKNLFEKKVSYTTYFCFIVAFAVLFFAQQRVSIVFFPIFLLLVSRYSGFMNIGRLKYVWGACILLVVAVGVFLVYYADEALLAYILERSVQSEENIVDQRFELFQDWVRFPLFGDGLGRYGHSAIYLFNKESITDCEYIRLINEVGIIGCSFLGMFYLIAMIRAFKYIKYYLFEFSVLLFLLAAMIGATPLENSSMQNYLLWYCMGRIFNKNVVKYKMIYEHGR